MDAARKQLLTGARFAYEQDAGAPARGDLVRKPDYLPESGTFANYMSGPGLADSACAEWARMSFDDVHCSETIRYT